MTDFSTNAVLAIEKSEVFKVESFKQSLVSSYELDRCIEWIKTNNLKKVCLQFPDTLLCDAASVSSYLSSNTNASVFSLADTSYASCCVDWVAAAHVEADAMIHFGPACLSPYEGLPVLYVFQPVTLNISDFTTVIMPIIENNGPTILIFETKFQKYYSELRDAFKHINDVFVSSLVSNTPLDESFLAICGRVIPKSHNYSRGIFLGRDSMLLTNIALALPGVSWIVYDGGSLTDFTLGSSKFLMKRLHLVEKLKDAASVGVLIGTLSVDGCLNAVERVKKLCKLSGKKCYTVAVGRPNVAKLANFPEIDVFVLISCPENEMLLNNSDFYQPIVTLLEVELALGGRPWSTEYSLDFRQLQTGGQLFTAEENKINSSEDNFETDVSLVTGKVRQMGHNIIIESESGESALMSRKPGALVEGRATHVLSGRTWGGLEQNLGQTSVEKVVQGRRGIPLAYHDEGSI